MKSNLYDEKSQYPIYNMQYKDYPPLFVVVIGPNPYPLVNELASKLSKQTVTANGIVTIGLKNKRVSIYGCSDFIDMIDCSKVCDLAILDVDKLEMMHFEFLALLSAHGMCKTTAVIRSDYNTIKRRLYKEVGMKTFSENNIWKLARMIIETKARPIEWRCSHPYVLIDNARDNCFYGYLRGGIVKKGMSAHLTNFGDVKVVEISKFGDPCFQECKKLELKKPIVYMPQEDELVMSEEYQTSESSGSDDFLLFSNKKTKISDLKVKLRSVVKNNEENENKSNEYKTDKNDKVVNDDEDINCNNKQDDHNITIDTKIDNKEDLKEKLKMIKDSIKGFIDNGYQTDDEEINTRPSEESNYETYEESNDEPDYDKKEEIKDDEIETNKKPEKDDKLENKEKVEDRLQKDDKLQKEDNYFLDLKKKMTEEFISTDSELRKMKGLLFPGEYVKIVIDNKNFIYDKQKLSILGFLQPGEEKMAIVQGKVVRNKFYRGMVRNERLIVSLGWRKFVVTPFFSMKDSTRNRMIKCMPLAMHCNLQFQGYHVQPGTPLCLIKDPFTENFRISGQGTVTEIFSHTSANLSGDENFNSEEIIGDLQKKIKLVGYPHKIHQNTAIIKNMFNSEKEVIKYQSGCLKTVSGLRGEIKKPVGNNGIFRATFEGQITMKDIVFLPCYIPINVLRDCFLFKRLDEVRFLTEESRKADRLAILNFKELENESDKGYNEKLDLKEHYKEEYDLSTEEFKIPKFLEKQLPIDKRRIVDDRVEFPIPPEVKSDLEFKAKIEKLRKLELKRIENEKLKGKIENKKREEDFLKIKKARIVKNIIENKRHKRKKR
ncbi:Ribosome biogenesis protein bms1 [Dictyocoela muelleri]|nr:Ribosome biogenesis protein bms1 [Dictyocoela muelleri]